MHIKVTLTAALLNVALSFIVELEARATVKTCVSELFQAGEPISVGATIHEPPRGKKFAAYVSIESGKRLLIAKRLDPAKNSTTVAFNNNDASSLLVCIDNFEKYPIYVELNIKGSSHHAVHEFVPTKGEYAELDGVLAEGTRILDGSYELFEKNEELARRLQKESGLMDGRWVFMSGAMLVGVIALGWLQVRIIRNELRNKKMY